MEEQNQQPQFSDEEMRMPGEENAVQEPSTESTHSVLGPVLGALIVVLVLILAGLYLWGNTLKNTPPPPAPATERPTPAENNEPESNTADAQVQALETVSTSDELDAIDADLESTDLDALDSELNAIDAELDAALQ